MMLRAAWLWVFASGCTAGPAGPGAASAPGPAAPGSGRSLVTAQPGDLAITDVSVVPMSSDGVLAHHTVVIRGDRIVAVAPSATVVLPRGTTVIAGAGKWLMPGLADMHVHTWNEHDLTMFVAAGVTTIRNMWGIAQHLDWRSQIARGERLGPTIVTAGNMIDGEPPDWAGSTVLVNPADADRIVTEQKAAGYDFLKSVAQLSREAYEALAAAAKRHGMVLAGHVPTAVGLEGVLAAQQRSVEHLDGWLAALVPPGTALPPVDDGEVWTRAVLSRLDPARLPGLIERTIAAGTWNCPTLVVYDRFVGLEDLAALRRRVAWLDKVPAAMRVRWVAPPSYTAEDFATVRATRAQLGKIVAALAAANAPILVGTDTGVLFVIPGAALHDEIELMIAAGVPRPRVLRAATADAWRYLGQPHEAGVVEVGARADLLLVASDPLTTPLPLIPDGVIVRGRWLSRGALEAQLAKIGAPDAPPADRWAGAAPLAVDGTVAYQARYDQTIAGTLVGEERVVVGRAGGRRAIAGQIADLSELVDASYTLGADTVTIAATYHAQTLAVTGKRTAGTLVVTGADLTGRPVSLRAPVPAGAVLSIPGIGGAIPLVEKLAGMTPGTARTLTSVELGYFPAIAIVPGRTRVARQPDRGGRRVFAVTATQGGATVTGEIVVDADGSIVAYTLGAPVPTSFTRRPQ
jgi:imidazolonepropionase-like amidohydrolase